MLVLGFESSCDETGVALVSTTEGVLAHALHSQVAMHEEYGGVVPELASRDHIKHIYPLTKQVLSQANVRLEEVDLIAYTAGPGLAGALLVGASFAQSIAMALQKPAVPIHHLEGHLLSPLLAVESPSFPFIALLVSGGHTQLMRVEKVGQYELLGETLDDAAGEAFDKSAKLLGLGYPGGPALAALAEKGNPDAIALPRPKMHSPDLDFSFSGLKTAVRTYIQKQDSPMPEQVRADIAAATQQAIVDVLVKKSLQALEQTGINTLVVAGGVGANRYLRQQLQAAQLAKGYQVYFPPIDLCTDNGAMIAFAAALRLQNGLASLEQQPYAFSVYPRWDLEEYTKQAF